MKKVLATAIVTAAATAGALSLTDALALDQPPTCDPAACPTPTQVDREQNARISRLEWKVKLQGIRIARLEERCD